MKIQKQLKRVCSLLCAYAAIYAMKLPVSFAATTSVMKIGDSKSGSGTTSPWPWHNFLEALKTELTGPVPMVLGILGIVGAAIALFSGNGGDGTRKFILLIFVISIALAAPSLMDMLYTGSGSTGFMIP